MTLILFSNNVIALQPVKPTYDKTEVLIPTKGTQPNSVVPLKEFKKIKMDFDYKNIISYLYGLDENSLVKDPSFPEVGISKPSSSAISFLLNKPYENNNILFQFTPDRIYFRDLKGDEYHLIGIRQVPLSKDLKTFLYNENSAFSTQFFVIRYVDPQKSPYQIELISAINPTQMIKESIYTDTYSLRNLSEKDNLIQISHDKQAFILHVKNSFYEPTKVQLKLLTLDIDSNLEVIDLDIVADITENLYFQPKEGQWISNRQLYRNPYFYDDYLKIYTSNHITDGLFDIKVEMEYQLFKPLTSDELPYKVLREYSYNKKNKRYEKISEKKILINN